MTWLPALVVIGAVVLVGVLVTAAVQHHISEVGRDILSSIPEPQPPDLASVELAIHALEEQVADVASRIPEPPKPTWHDL